MIEKYRLLERVELVDVSGDLSEKGIGHEHGCLVAMTRLGIAEQGRDIDLQCIGKALERGERRHGFPVLYLRDIGTGNVHAPGKLTLRQVTHVPQIAHGGSNLNPALLGGFLLRNDCECGGYWLRLLSIEGLVAAAAECVRGTELHQAAVIATEYLPLFDGRHHCCHTL